MLEKNYGILTVEEVSEGFMQLVENCGNGAVVIVFKVFLVSLESSKSYNCLYPFQLSQYENTQGAPPMVYHDFSLPLVYGMAILAVALNKVEE